MPSAFTNKTQTLPPPEQEHLPCPRCESNNTKFCYYNNYNFAQPRYFCKACRRYWTQGGALRNIPIGGGSRKNSKRNRNLNTTSSSTSSDSHSCSNPAVTSVNQSDITAPLNLPVVSFTSLLNTQGQELSGLGLGFDNMGIVGMNGGGAVWSSLMNFGNVGPEMWQLGNDCMVWPDLNISTPTRCLM